MERGRLFYHYLEGEELTCEPDGESINGDPRFKVCVIGDDERIEVRNLSVKEMMLLRDKLSAAIESVAAKEPARTETNESGEYTTREVRL